MTRITTIEIIFNNFLTVLILNQRIKKFKWAADKYIFQSHQDFSQKNLP